MKVLVLSAMSRPETATHVLAQLAVKKCEELGADVDLVTPADLSLPVNDGTLPWDLPQLDRWRSRVDESDGTIWVSPEYHGALAASLKNMFDYLNKAPLEGDVVGLCALAGGAVSALNTLNGMAVIARSLGAWVVPNMCAFGTREVREGLGEGSDERLGAMCATVVDTIRRLKGSATAVPDPALAATVASLERAHAEGEDETGEEEAPAAGATPEPAAAAADAGAPSLGVPGLSGVEEVARGISGTRYRAERQGQPVVVRLVPAALLDEPHRARFAADQEKVRGLPPHPNIVPVGDAGMTGDGAGYVVSAGGPSLAERLRDTGAMPWRDVVDSGVRMAGALETIHRSGLLHRDLGPLNVLLDGDGRPGLADVAVAPEGVKTFEHQRQVALAHLAPELFRGDPPSAASDIYALGATLFAMVVARPAFTDSADRKIVALIRRIAVEPVPDLRSQLPDPVCVVIERAMAKIPADRFGTAEELGRALQQAQMMTELPTATMTLFAPGGLTAAAAATGAVSVFGPSNEAHDPAAGPDLAPVTTSTGSEVE